MKLLNAPKELTTKGELATYLYGNNANVESFDCAVPMQWVRIANDRLPDETINGERISNDIARHVVMVYYKDKSTRIMPVTDFGLRALCTLATYINC